MLIRLKRHVITKIRDVLGVKDLKLHNFQLTPKPNQIGLTVAAAHLSKYNQKTLEKLTKDKYIKRVFTDKVEKKECFVFELRPNELMRDVLETPVGVTIDDTGNVECHEARKRIVVDFSSINIAKPFHLGHLRSTILGNYLSNLHQYLNDDVIRLNYLGDWGTQFGYVIAGLNHTPAEQLKTNPMRTLLEAYVNAHKLAETNPAIHEEAKDVFRKMEMSDADLIARWEQIKRLTVTELERTYARLNVKFDEYHWESMYSSRDIQGVIDELKGRGLLKHVENDGRFVYENARGRPVPLIKSDGTCLYLTRDIAAAIDRYERFNFDRMYYVVDNSQADHFANLFEILQQMEKPFAQNLCHVKFGRVLNMSTRTGDVVFLTDILDEIRERMMRKQMKTATTKVTEDEIVTHTADVLGLSCVIVNDLRQKRTRDYEINWKKVLQTDGDTGAKLQYTHCRLASLKLNCGVQRNGSRTFDARVLSNDKTAMTLAIQMARFHDAVYRSRDDMEACVLVNYLFHLCSAINRAFKTLPVKNQPDDVAQNRLQLFTQAQAVLATGMRLLGVKPLDRM